jgi:hypothetical protein
MRGIRTPVSTAARTSGSCPTWRGSRRSGCRRGNIVRRRGRTKTPAGTRPVDLPPSIAKFYELLLDSHSHPLRVHQSRRSTWRRSNFRDRYWRPAWDGIDVDKPESPEHLPEILPWFTFHEGRHTQSTWMIEEAFPRSPGERGWPQDEGHRTGLRPRHPGHAPADRRRPGTPLGDRAGRPDSHRAGPLGVVVSAPGDDRFDTLWRAFANAIAISSPVDLGFNRKALPRRTRERASDLRRCAGGRYWD